MLNQVVFTPSPKPSKTPVLKIKNTKSDIKVHKLNFNESLGMSPELSLRGSQSSVNDITQAWNRLKINALSKAIAIAPDVGPCSIGPNAVSLVEEENSEPDAVDSDKPNLKNVVTSTPLKSKSQSENGTKNSISVTSAEKNNCSSFDVSEIKPDNNFGYKNDKTSELETLRLNCLQKIEIQVRRYTEKKKDDCWKMLMENDEKVKEKLAALKIELDREHLLRLQEHYIQTQKQITETKASAQLKAEQLQQNQADHDKRITETGDRLKEIEQRRKELEEKQKEKREELKRCIDGIYGVQVTYGKIYNQITETTKKCRDIRLLNDKVYEELVKLRGMNEQLLKVVEKSKEGKVTLNDLKFAETLVQQITAVSETFSRHTDDINNALKKAEEDKKKEQLEKDLKVKQEEAELQRRAQEEREKVEKEKVAKSRQSSKLLTGIEDCISGECLKWYLQLSKNLEEYEKKLEPLLNNDSLKKFRFECQKVVNVPVNAISPLDDIHLEDKFYKLSRLLQGQAVPLGNTLFLVTGHPLGIAYCTNLLAKKFVKQGEYAVSGKPEAAFAIAAVIVALWVDFPEFGRLLLAHFHRECPYLIPAFLPQVEGQSNENYYKMLGYQYSEDGKVEPQDMFLRRMSGVMRLYAAIFVTQLKRSQVMQHKKHPHGLRDAWRWFAATLNLRPRTDISPTLVFDFLEVTGRMFYHTYSTQFTKLLHLLCADYLPLIEHVTPDGCGGPVVRLKTFLEKILKEGQVPPPAGLLPPNFW